MITVNQWIVYPVHEHSFSTLLKMVDPEVMERQGNDCHGTIEVNNVRAR